MKNKKRTGLGALILSLLMLTLIACNVAPLVPPADKIPVCENKPITVKVTDLPGNCVAIKEAKLTLTDPSGKCTSEVWKSCAPTPVAFNFTESGCYKFCVEVTGMNGAKFYYSGSFPLELKEQYNLEVVFDKGVIKVSLKKVDGGTGSEWQISSIPETGELDYNAFSLALTPQGSPAVVYANPDGSRKNLFYKELVKGSWTGSQISNEAVALSNSSLVYDAAGMPKAVYTIDGHTIAVETTFNGTGWDRRWLKAYPPYGMDAPLALTNSKGELYRLYSYRKDKLGDRQVELSGPNGSTGELPGQGYALALDNNESPLFLYKKDGSTYYGPRLPDVFLCSTVEAPLDFIKRDFAGLSLAVDRDNRESIAFFNNEEKKLYFTKNVNGSWQTETVEDAGITYGNSSLAFDNQGNAVIAYYDAANADLKVARQTAKGWEITVVESNGDVGSSCKVKVDGNNTIIIAYFDKTAGAIKIATSK